MSKTEKTDIPFRIGDEDGYVVVKKVFTGTGERLELRAEVFARSNRLDAIILESVAWQDQDRIVEQATNLDRGEDVSPRTIQDGEERDGPITVSNEFALAEIEKDNDDERLKIHAPKLGYTIHLGPRELEWLAVQNHEMFTEWLEHPFGPGTDEHDH